MKTLQQIIETCVEKTKSLETLIPIEQYQNRIVEIDDIANGNIWNNPKSASDLMKERQKLSSLLKDIFNFKEQSSFFLQCLTEMPNEIDELKSSIYDLESSLNTFELKQILKEPVDNSPAILSISAGAGGLEAANWVSMLLRMYCRYADAAKFSVEIIDRKDSEDSEEYSAICIDSVSIRVEGEYAYGYLKSESGVHRLIRNSPFNGGDLRHTSFAAVSVSPDIEDTLEIKINDKDLEITTQTAGGPGGQNVNRIKSAIRLKHIPTGINIFVRNERDQHSNRRIAMKMLKAKLYDLEIKKKNVNKEEFLASLRDVSFGNQIRTTTLTPYTLVKDHRTDYEERNVDKVLDGDIRDFIISYLKKS